MKRIPRILPRSLPHGSQGLPIVAKHSYPGTDAFRIPIRQHAALCIFNELLLQRNAPTGKNRKARCHVFGHFRRRCLFEMRIRRYQAQSDIRILQIPRDLRPGNFLHESQASPLQ